jgi:hypothetical protein
MGALYANAFFNRGDLKSMGGAAAQVYVYAADGKLISSSQGDGAWPAGSLIEVEPGDYLVEVGQHRTRHNLRRYTVQKGQITLIPTSWVAVTTWPRQDQPTQGCRPWDAELRVYVLDAEGKEHLVGSNEGVNAAQGRVQLAAGKYRVSWHGLIADVELVENQILHLGTGGVGPFPGANARLAAEKSDKAGVPYIELCGDGPTHVLAGRWWMTQVEKIEEYPYEKRVWQEVEVPALDESITRALKADSVKGKLYRGEGSQGVAPSAEELKALAGYKEGTLQKTTRGGKFDFDNNPF